MQDLSFPEFDPVLLQGRLRRMVESQEVVATRSIVSNLAKQDLLEAMLDRYSKPKPQGYPAQRHYLFSTPFRYPPLKYGSRFGDRYCPSLFYGSKAEGTVLAESAYYRLVFWHDMENAPSEPIEARHTMFVAAYRAPRGVDLSQPPFDVHQDAIRHPSDYRFTQALGAHLRELRIGCFTYASARDPEAGHNVAIFEPDVLVGEGPLQSAPWASQVDGRTVSFVSIREQKRTSFCMEHFCLADGRLPYPAS